MSDMTGGSSNVAMSATVPEKVFYLGQPADVIALLRHVHQSPLDTEQKNTLRDAVFSAQHSGNNQGHDELTAMFAEIGMNVVFGVDESVASADKQPVQTVATPDPVKKMTHSFARPRPDFSHKTTQSSVTSPEAQQAVSKPSVSSSAHHDTAALTADHTSFIPETVSTAPESSSEAVVQNSEPAEPAESELEKTTAPQASVVTEVTKEPSVSPEPTIVATAANPSTRIDAIKKAVNDRVGNPVNLIDANNEIGREYMNALLDAMKKVNGGTQAADMERAMNRLETSFRAVETMLGASAETMSAPVAETAVVENDTTAEKVPVETKKSETPVEPQKVPVKSTAEIPPATKSEVEQPVSKNIAVTSVLEEADKAIDHAAADNRLATKKTTDKYEHISGNEQQAPPRVLREQVVATPTAPEVPIVPQTDSVTTPSNPAASSASEFTPVAKEKQLEQLLKDKEQEVAANKAALEEEIKTNPLMASDVDDGLKQLLSEWKLFKSSGLFGTGPSGIDHPLYTKIAHLTMAAVLAGRFDDATADIRKNINEYLSGWRYEEGITHEMGETFEHYLRRVIRHILDRKRN